MYHPVVPSGKENIALTCLIIYASKYLNWYVDDLDYVQCIFFSRQITLNISFFTGQDFYFVECLEYKPC